MRRRLSQELQTLSSLSGKIPRRRRRWKRRTTEPSWSQSLCGPFRLLRPVADRSPSREQNFLNYVSLRDYRNAILLALAMQQPGRLLSLFKSIRGGPDVEGLSRSKSFTGSPAVDEVIRTMSAEDLTTLIKFVRDWNSNAKTSEIAQGILHAIVKLRSADDIMDMFKPQATLAGAEQLTDGTTGLKEIVDGLISYTERHLARMERLIQESYVVDFLLEEMDQGMLCGADLMEVDG